MSVNHLFLAFFIVVATFLGNASAENHPSYYEEGHSLTRYTPQQDHPNYYKEGHSQTRYTPEEDHRNYYEEGHSLKRDTPQEDYPTYKEGQSLKRDAPKEDNCATIRIQGMIYCKNNNGNLSPMQGATARVTCMVKDTKNGYETAPLSVETPVTDNKGYFLINLATYITPRYSVSNCRVFLDEAASEHCYVPTNINKGVSGAHLDKSRSRRLDSDGSTLYSVGPFAFKTPSY